LKQNADHLCVTSVSRKRLCIFALLSGEFSSSHKWNNSNHGHQIPLSWYVLKQIQ
jgi:hypothetical protein